MLAEREAAVEAGLSRAEEVRAALEHEVAELRGALERTQRQVGDEVAKRSAVEVGGGKGGCVCVGGGGSDSGGQAERTEAGGGGRGGERA